MQMRGLREGLRMCADERLERRSTDVCCCRGCVSFGCVQMSGLSEELRLCVAAGAV